MMRYYLAVVLAACGGTTSSPDASTSDAASSDVVVKDGTTPGDASSDVVTPSDGGVEAGPGTYSAASYSGGLEHMFVFKADSQRKLCFEISLAAPSVNNSGVTLPPQWAVMYAMAFDDDKACVYPYTGDAGMTLASGESGKMDWPDSGFGIPPVISTIAVTLDFDAGPSWAPPSEVLSATNVPVQ